jgi:hypothetical protein
VAIGPARGEAEPVEPVRRGHRAPGAGGRLAGMGPAQRAAWLFLVLGAIACGSGSGEALHVGGGSGTGGSGGSSGSGGGGGGDTGGAGGSPEAGGAGGQTADAGVEDAAAAGGAAGAGLDAGVEAGNDPNACPPTKPADGSACNVLINSANCIYGMKNCVCTVTTWLCVP